MASVPIVGGSEGTWGTLLNAWLQTEHNADASHNTDTFIDTMSTKLLFNLNGEVMVNSSGELVYLKE